MRTLRAFGVLLLVAFCSGCSVTQKPSMQQAWEAAELECDDPREDECVSLLCLGDTCGFYRCADRLGGVELARFPPARPPAAAAAPGSGPRRNWGGAQKLPPGSIMTFPNWNGSPEEVIPPSHRLPSGRWEKHHIFPQEPALKEWFELQGVRIHHFTMPIPYELHHRIHRGGGAWRRLE
uniref:SitA6 family polymorphic toxin lipoprotein n=1 Tax=Myxococcus guangdongensis TaxID=2906760 RepID=UPI002B1F8BE5|nr:TIGR02269 family lipoprotein [Myxococcus guangdongensis]